MSAWIKVDVNNTLRSTNVRRNDFMFLNLFVVLFSVRCQLRFFHKDLSKKVLEEKMYVVEKILRTI